MAATIILFTEIPKLQWHYNHVIGSLYLIATFQLHLYIFFHRDFVVPLFSPPFNLISPFLAIPLYMAYLIPVPAAPPQPAHQHPLRVIL